MLMVQGCRAFGGSVLTAPYHCVLPAQVDEGGPHFVHHSQQVNWLEARVARQGVVPGLAGVLVFGALVSAAPNTSHI